MSFTVQTIINDASADSRYNLDGSSGTGAAFNLMVPWVDRIHKDILHQSIYAHHSRRVTSVTSVAQTRSYTIGATDVRRIEMVFDTVQNRILLPFDDVFNPVSGADPTSLNNQPVAMQNQDLWDRTQSIFPSYYRITTATSSGTNTHTLYLFPVPATASQAGNIDIHYMKEVASLSAGADPLEVPEDARDCVVAGVNWLMFSYLKRPTEAQGWAQLYESLKRGERAK